MTTETLIWFVLPFIVLIFWIHRTRQRFWDSTGGQKIIYIAGYALLAAWLAFAIFWTLHGM